MNAPFVWKLLNMIIIVSSNVVGFIIVFPVFSNGFITISNVPYIDNHQQAL